MSDYTSPDRKYSALLIIDVQRDFNLKGATVEIPGTMQAVPYILALVQKYREQGFPIIHIIRLYRVDGYNIDLSRRRTIEEGKQMVILGSDGAEIMDELKPSSDIRLDSSTLLSDSLQKIDPWNG